MKGWLNGRISLLVVVLLLSLLSVSVTAASNIPKCELPGILTAPGQAPEYAFVKIILDRAKLDVICDPMFSGDELGKYKALMLIIGGSGKGLGSAGIDIETEVSRATYLINKAKELNIKIIGMHLGGEARRGANSERFIDLVTPKVDILIVRADGDKDGRFSSIARENNIPFVVVDKTADLAGVFETIF